jgi:hypothetical protein
MIVNTKAVKSATNGSGNQVSLNQNREKINMYDEPPRVTISLHEFHQIALNRLQLLKKIEFM